MRYLPSSIAILCSLLLPAFSVAATRPVWAEWLEPDYPFFSSVLDARKAGAGFPGNNLTPRGIVINLGRDQWACFDVDLLRLSAVWRGSGVTAVALAPGSYHKPDQKTPPGQSRLPQPAGTVWLANGIYPGWQKGDGVSLADPREPAPSPEEVGRGPLNVALGRFQSIRLTAGGAVLDYTVAGAEVSEWITVSPDSERPVVERQFKVGPSVDPLLLVLGLKRVDPGAEGAGFCSVGIAARDPSLVEIVPDESAWIVRVASHETASEFSVALAEGGTAPSAVTRSIPTDVPQSRWPEEILTRINVSTSDDAYVADDIALPLDNPWRRDVRISDIQFLRDGTGVAVTIDGDVWLVRGLNETDGTVRWKRFSSGLHEPMTLAIRDEQIYVFDRNGIWRLRDTNGDGEADVHELFSNAFAQTADTREFPSTVRLAPGGEFVIAKGGQESTTIGKHNGSVLRVTADGLRSTILGYGFRQPNIGVNVRTGLVTASDQQGHYVPSTPLHIVEGGQFYGFLSGKLPREKYPAPIAEPLTWIPHAVNPSGLSQVWLHDAQMGPLNDALIHISFNRPELFRVLLNHRGARLQAAVVRLAPAFDFAPLNGSVNPQDGQLYIAGFQVLGWGTTATRIAGLARIRYTGAASLIPNEVVAMDQGVLLRFNVPLDPEAAVRPESYALSSWGYERTYKYGSPQLKADGTPGVDSLVPSSAYLSKDRRSVFVAVAGMKPVMQMQVDWTLATAGGIKVKDSAWFTPYELTKFDPQAEGFGDIVVNLTSPAPNKPVDNEIISAAEGMQIAQRLGCVGCHSITDRNVVTPGPSWLGLFGQEHRLVNGGVATVDEDYIRESILNPSAKIPVGYNDGEFSMPSYSGVVTDSQIESLILFIKSLDR